MDHPRRARPQLHPVEDRVAPSRGGFDHGPAPGHQPGPEPALVRDHPSGYDHAGPFVGNAPARRGPEAELVVLRVAAAQTSPPAPRTEPAAQLVVAPALTDPTTAQTAGASHLPPSSAQTPAADPPAAPGRAPVANVLIEAATGGVRAAAFTTAFVGVAAVNDAAPLVEVAPAPATPEAAALPAPAWDFAPLVVELPGLAPLAGALGIDVAAVEEGVRQALDFVADVAPIPVDEWGADGWVAAAAVLAGGAGWVGVRARRRPPAADAVFLGWGEAR